MASLDELLDEVSNPSRAYPDLDDHQEQAVLTRHPGAVVVDATAGSGKTRVLTRRAVHLLRTGTNAKHLAVVTFTRKAAGVLQERMSQLGVTDLPVCATVHSLAWKMHPQELASQEQLLALCEELPSPWGPAETLLNVQRIRESQQRENISDPLAIWFEEELLNQGLKDFTDLLLQGVHRPNPKFKHILIDEYQDLTPLQLQFLSLQLVEGGSLYLVGDTHQQIYSFRGSLSTLDSLKPLRLSLPWNYRSAQTIVSLSSNLFEDTRINVRAIRQEQGKVTTFAFEDEQQELESCVAWLSESSNRALLGRTQESLTPYKELGLNAFTVHEAKGLEWDEVRIIGCEQTNMPHILGTMDEERRIFYVAMTRAVDCLEMTFCKTRSGHPRKPSSFLLDLQFTS